MAEFKLPAIQAAVQIVDIASGRMTAYFSDWLTRVLTQISQTITDITGVIASLAATQQSIQKTQQTLVAAIAQLQAVQAAAAQAQATADAAGGGGAQSGVATATFNVGLGWSFGPQVDLTGVTAGNLTIAGSGPTQGPNTYVDTLGDWSGQWRIQEIVGAVATTVATGTFVVGSSNDPDSGFTTYYLYNETDTSSTSIARSSTGAVSYRLDLQLLQPVSAFYVIANLYVRRA